MTAPPSHASQSPSSTSAQPAASTNAPAHAIRRHGLKATVWRNPTRNGPMYSVTLVRTYRDGQEFRDTPSLGFGDLANAAKLLLDAESWIAARASDDRAAEEQRAEDRPAPPPPQRTTRRSGSGRTA